MGVTLSYKVSMKVFLYLQKKQQLDIYKKNIVKEKGQYQWLQLGILPRFQMQIFGILS